MLDAIVQSRLTEQHRLYRSWLRLESIELDNGSVQIRLILSLERITPKAQIISGFLQTDQGVPEYQEEHSHGSHAWRHMPRSPSR